MGDVSVARIFQQEGSFLDIEDPDYWDGEQELGIFIIMTDLQTGRTLWKSDCGRMGHAIGFMRAGLLVHGELNGEGLYLLDELNGTTLRVFGQQIYARKLSACCL